MTTILLKRGTGAPTDLAYGEVAVDATAKVLYAGTADGKVVELSGGNIDWGQIDNIPDFIIEIDPNNPDYINLSDLEKQVIDNSKDVVDLKSDVSQIWILISQIQDSIAAMESDISSNAIEISKNSSDITALQNEIAAIESGLIFGGVYSPVTNKITDVDKYASDRGFSEGDTLPANTTANQQGIYFITSVAGNASINGSSVDLKAGDWLIANKLAWTVVSYGFETITIDQIAGLSDELNALHSADNNISIRVDALENEIDGGTYTGTPPNFRS